MGFIVEIASQSARFFASLENDGAYARNDRNAGARIGVGFRDCFVALLLAMT